MWITPWQAVAVWWQPRATSDVDVVVIGPDTLPQSLRSAVTQEPAFLFEPETLSLPPHTVLLRAHLRAGAEEEPDLILWSIFCFCLPNSHGQSWADVSRFPWTIVRFGSYLVKTW
jgi:hypothetical protein